MNNDMALILFEASQQTIAEPDTERLVIDDPQDALDLMANASYQGASSVILYETNLNPAFFDLRSGLAGEIMLKFTNYWMKLAVIGEFEKYPSKSLQAFIAESNRGKQFFFVPDRGTALQKLTQ
jgi:hypothetical protein